MLQLGAMRLVEDPLLVSQAGSWLLAAIDESSVTVGGLASDSFEHYARVFHPAMREATEADLPLRSEDESATGVPVQRRAPYGVVMREVTWTEVAHTNGKVAHAGMQWASITGSFRFLERGSQPGLWDERPQQGSLPRRLAHVLSQSLEPFTGTPNQCWFAVWEGYGDLVGLRAYRDLPRLAIAGNYMLLGEGPLDAITASPFSDPGHQPLLADRYRSPNLWWPDDHAWCVATGIDFDSTYLGASAECVRAVTDEPQLEAMRIPKDQKVTWDSDALNPVPPRE
ncbi:MAG: hypothetical protein M0T77_14875 [Actinomycetota bacterium]|nr:hypothetical protein [Actinomycetota bacterium]